MRIYTSQASKRHYWHENHSREAEPEYSVDSRSIDSDGQLRSARADLTAQHMDKTPDTQIAKFYRKYGEDWIERFRRNERGCKI